MKTVLKQLLLVVCLQLSAAQLAQASGEILTASTRAGNEGYIKKSADGGTSWTTVWNGNLQSALSDKSGLQDIASGDGKIVAVGKSIVYSLDNGATWTEKVIRYPNTKNGIHRNSQRYFYGVAYGAGMFLAVGTDDHIMYSSDAVHWQHVGLDTPFDTPPDSGQPKHNEFAGKYSPPHYIETPKDVIFTQGKFVVVGGQHKLEIASFERRGNQVVVKEVVNLGPAAGNVLSGLSSIASDGKSTLWAVGKSTKSAYSTDGGTTWTVTENPDKKQLSAVAFGNNTWVALNGFMNVFTAKSPSQGFVAAPDLTMALRGVVFNAIKFANGKFYAFGNDHRVMTSVDGSTWVVNPARDAAVDAFGALFVE